MAVKQVRDVVTYAHVRELNPADWADIGTSARTPAAAIAKAVLRVRRIDGQLQKWVFMPGALYLITEIGLIIQGNIDTPPPV